MSVYFLSNFQGTRSLERRSSETPFAFLEGSWALTSLLTSLAFAFQRQKPVLLSDVVWDFMLLRMVCLEGLWPKKAGRACPGGEIM